jgi:NCS2 family nucleobase:cation symporter-2
MKYCLLPRLFALGLQHVLGAARQCGGCAAQILATVDYVTQRNNALVVAVSIGFGVIPIVSPNFFRIMPAELKPIFGDPIILTSLAAVTLNAFLNQTTNEQARQDSLLAAHAEHA